jgi:AraC-like DNA-binding protein/ligand-binding sensor protein
MGEIYKSEDPFERVATSQLFAQYRTAFEAATGLPLEIHDPESVSDPGLSENSNPFCRILNQHNRCPDCAAAAHCIGRQSRREPRAIACFAGLSESTVPILAGQVEIAHLRTGQIFTEGSATVEWPEIEVKLVELGYNAKEVEKLQKSWLKTDSITGEKYQGIVTLMAVFAGQLSELAERLLLEQSESEPAMIVKARQFVSAHLAEPIELNQVAAHVGVSQFHFCRLFKQSTGLTFKQYLTRRRIEWAKCRLRKPNARVTEVAYDVGFGSLSQFNRSFQQVAGTSPSDWRMTEQQKLAISS